MNWIAKKIRETRKIKGITQEELAEQAKINLRTIQRIENSENVPRGKTLHLICQALEIDSEELDLKKNYFRDKNIGKIIVYGLYLILINAILIKIIGFLTLDTNANLNSLVGGFLLSIFLPFFIVVFTKKMTGLERSFKFGFGYMAGFILIIVNQGFRTGFKTGIFYCLLASLTVLYFGNELTKNKA